MFLAAILASILTAEMTPTNVVESFYRAWAAGDPRATEAWHPGAAREAFGRSFARTRRTRCMQLEQLAIESETGDGDATVIRVRGLITKRSSLPGARAYTDPISSAVTLRRVDGAWKIASIRDVEDERARAIVGAADAERAALLLECGDDCFGYPFLAALRRRTMAPINQQHYERAERLAVLAETIAREAGDDRAISAALSTHASVARLNSTPEASVRFAEESLLHAERSGDVDSIARALLRLGRARWEISHAAARVEFERGFALADQVEDVSIAALLATQLAYLHDLELDHRTAMLYSLQATALSEEAGDPTTAISARMNIGRAYRMQGDLAMGRMHLEAALSLARELGLISTAASILENLASVALELDDVREARERIAEASATIDAEDDTFFEVLLTRGSVHARTGNFAAAEADYREVLRSGEHAGKNRLIAWAYNGLTESALQQKRFDDALGYAWCAEEASRLLDRSIRPPLQKIPRILRAMGRTEDALRYLERSVATLDTERSQLFGTDLQKKMFYDDRAWIYLEHVELLIERGDSRGAWAALQRMRSRVLQGSRNPPPNNAGDHARRTREQRIVTLNRALADPKNRARRKSLLRSLEQARFDLADYDARAAAVREDATPKPVDDRNSRSRIPDDLVVVEYVELESQLLLFVVTRDGVHHVIVPATRAALQRRVAAFVGQIEARDQNYRDEARALYDLLLAPVESHIRGKTLVIVPHGDLWRLPFQALRTRRGKHLVEEQVVFYANSVAQVEMARIDAPRNPETELLAFANPRIAVASGRKFRALYRNSDLGALPHAEEEVRALSRIYGKKHSRIYVGAEAREAVFKREAGAFRILHIATHGVLDDAAPLYSALLLAASEDDTREDGLLEAREIMDMQLTADLAVLAACETGRGAISPGEGVIGMSWALLLAGCPTVAVSQWKTESAATAQLMIAFHKELAGGRSPAAALRTAERALMGDPRYAHPFYWAPFVVVGAGQ